MLSNKEFNDWFKKEVESRWPKHRFDWTEVGDWHWRLREGFDLDTLTEAVRQHKACDDFRTPSLKKVYDYAKAIQSRNRPQRDCGGSRERSDNSGVPEHTFIMCTAKDEHGHGKVGWFVPILLWPFKTQWTPQDYQRVAAEQARRHADFYRGIWDIFTDTNHGEMLTRSSRLRNAQHST